MADDGGGTINPVLLPPEANKRAKTSSPATTKKILLLGDSLTQTGYEGWVSELANAYQRRADVLNRGCSGYNTAMYLQHVFPQVLREIEAVADDLVLVVVFFGANDAALAEVDAHHHVPLPEFRGNLREMVTRTREKACCNCKVLLITPPPVHHKQRLEYQVQRFGAEKATGVLERTNSNTLKYADAVVDVGLSNDVPVVDLFRAMVKGDVKGNETATLSDKDYDDPQQQETYGPYLSDGLHFAKEGHEFLARLLLHCIFEKYFDKELAVVADAKTGQYCNSSSTCGTLLLPQSYPYHDEL